jgi:hypothetical protein
MQKNETNPKVEHNILCWEKLNHITSFFFTYSTKAIQDNVEKLNFWQQVLMGSELMDDIEHRKELNRIIEMNQALACLTLQYSNEDILKLLEFIQFGKEITQNILAEQRKEEKHA